MKKYEKYHQEWHRIHTRSIFKRAVTRPYRLIRRQRGEPPKDILRWTKLTVPKTFDFSENYRDSVRYLDDLKRSVLEDNKAIIIDLSECEWISPDGCIVLAALIERCKILRPKFITGTYPNNPKLSFILEQLGFFSLIKVSPQPIGMRFSGDIRIVKLLSGDDGAPNAVMRGMKELFAPTDDAALEDEMLGKGIYRALTEAMLNAIEHAYPDIIKSRKDCVPKWWRWGIRFDNTVYMVLYDQGAGIPDTIEMKLKEMVDNLGSLLTRRPLDSEKIVLAMELGRTSSGKEGKGKGLPDYKRVVNYRQKGWLRINSHRGEYVYNAQNGDVMQKDHPLSLEGTMITWKIELG